MSDRGWQQARETVREAIINIIDGNCFDRIDGTLIASLLLHPSHDKHPQIHVVRDLCHDQVEADLEEELHAA